MKCAVETREKFVLIQLKYKKKYLQVVGKKSSGRNSFSLSAKDTEKQKTKKNEV